MPIDVKHCGKLCQVPLLTDIIRSQSFEQNGHINIGGLLIQWGFEPWSSGELVTFDFEIRFPKSFLETPIVVATPMYDQSSAAEVIISFGINHTNNESFHFEARYKNPSLIYGINWIAIGA